MSETWTSRYLRLLGEPVRAPGPEALAALTRAHLHRVPFENVSKLLHRDDPTMRVPPIERYLDGIERHGFGGTCYANNSHFAELLRALGYDVRLCGADMSTPDVHLVSIVTLAGHEWLVDVGYGAPFAAPMPLAPGESFEVTLGADRWVLGRDESGRAGIAPFREGRRRHGYRVNPTPRRIEEFRDVIERSFQPLSMFLTTLVVVRFEDGGSLHLTNRTLTTSRGRAFVREVLEGDLPAHVERRFGMPAALVRRAIDGVDLSRDPWA